MDNKTNNITIFMRNGGIYVSQTDAANTPISIGQRLTSGGFIVCEDTFWDKHRQLIINLADVSAVVIEAKA